MRRKYRGKRGRRRPIRPIHRPYRPIIEIPTWVYLIIFILLCVFLIKVKIPYDIRPISDSNVYCENDEVLAKNDFAPLGVSLTSLSVSMNCMDYKSSSCKVFCDNGKPACRCVAVGYDLLFSRKGEWVLDYLG